MPFLNAWGGESIESDPNVILQFGGFRENAETLPQKFADRKIERSSEFCFADPNISNSRKRKSTELLTIDIEREQVPQILDGPEMIRLDITLLKTIALRLFVFKTNLELLEYRVAQLLEQMDIGGGSTGCSE